jgi:hypothetical protein
MVTNGLVHDSLLNGLQVISRNVGAKLNVSFTLALFT